MYNHVSSSFHHVYMLHPQITQACPVSIPFGGSIGRASALFHNPGQRIKLKRKALGKR